MKYPLIKAIITLAIFSVPVQYAAAACNKATIKGNFAGESYFPETKKYYASHGAVMLNFSGAGKIVIKKFTEGANGFYGAGNGSGTYNLGGNCTGVANITIKQNGLINAKGRMDFVVGGTKANPEIFGTYTNKTDGTSGNVHLIKSSL